MRQKSKVIYDTQTEGATAINMCLGTPQTDQACLLVGSEFVDCGCGDRSLPHRPGQIVFTSLLEHKFVHTQPTAVAPTEELYRRINGPKRSAIVCSHS